MKSIIALCVVVAGAAVATFSIANNSPSKIDRIGVVNSSTVPTGYTVHEWGTFTSVFGSDGTMLPGLEVEEESLPPFVYAHDGMNGRVQLPSVTKLKPTVPAFLIMAKGYQRPLHNVTVKMETPVLYFYSPKKIDAHVRVDFKGGSISQWYPARSGGEIPPIRKVVNGVLTDGAIDFGEKPYQGRIDWKFTIEARGANTDFEVMKAHETSTWIHPRAPRSNVVRTANGDADSFLFYRGVGDFELPINFRVSEDQELTVEADEAISYLLIVEIVNGKVCILSEGAVSDALSIDLKSSTELMPMKEMRLGIYSGLKGALLDAGLFEDEAAAMLRTWWNSYFGRDGIRAFWVVPRSFTDKILPIQLEPAPENLERVLLGRSEILTPKFEFSLVNTFEKTAKQALEQKRKPYNPYGGDRYAKAYEARVKVLAPGLKLP